MEQENEGLRPTSVPRELDDAGEGSTDPLKPPPGPEAPEQPEGGSTIHSLLVIAGILLILWIVGLAGNWTAGMAWTLFLIAAVCFALWSTRRPKVLT